VYETGCGNASRQKGKNQKAKGKNQKAKVMKKKTGSAGVSPAFSTEKAKGENQEGNVPYDLLHSPQSAMFSV